MTSVAQAAALLVLAPVGVGLLLLLRWMREPIVQAQLLAKETDPAQENSFEDPNDANPRTRLYGTCDSVALCIYAWGSVCVLFMTDSLLSPIFVCCCCCYSILTDARSGRWATSRPRARSR